MNCINCGSPILEGDLFCTKCGTPAPTEKRCPNCQALLAEDDLFCGKCGTRIVEVPQSDDMNQNQAQPQTQTQYQPPYQNPANFYGGPNGQKAPYQKVPQMPYQNTYQNPYQNANQTPYQNMNQNPYQHQGYNPGYGAQPKKYNMISKYIGEPVAGISPATGTMYVYEDRLEFHKVLGSALGNAFGPLGMAMAAKKEKNSSGKVEVYYFQDIQTAYVGKYMAMMPSVVLVLNDGQVFSFTGTFTNQSAANVVNTILYNK